VSAWVIHMIQAGGYWGIALLMALENIFPPIPSELIMGVGGMSVAHGRMQFVPLLIAGTIGSALGNYVLFLIADRLGYERLRPFIERWGRWLTMEWEDVERVSRFFRKRGGVVVFVFRFMPMFRSVISIPAGLAHMGHVRFLLYTAAGAAIWNVLLIWAGRWAGNTFGQAEKWLGWATIVVAVLSAAFYLWRVLTWKPAKA